MVTPVSRKTKIICTIGPSSQSPGIVKELILSGMNVARLNFSHGTHSEHGQTIRTIREISHELNKPIAILQDLCGPKIRVGKIPGNGFHLEPEETITLTTTQATDISKDRIYISYPDLHNDVRTADRILLADGLMELEVIGVFDNEIRCKVITGGVLTSHKGVNLPTSSIRAETLTEKDKSDLHFGIDQGVDYVALSFVRTAEDILQTQKIINERNADIPVIAKIEKHEALNNIEAIMDSADGIMVARGDLGVEIPLENVPGIQKQLVNRANFAGKPVIIATQMLRSMVNSVRPTRAEAADVANAVWDGADAVMLSEETASGHYPVDAVNIMTRIILDAEKYYPHDRFLSISQQKNIPESVAHASCMLADHLDAAAIVATTRSGFTAIRISRFRPKTRIIALSPDEKTIRRLTLHWGCYPGFVTDTKDTDVRIEQSVNSAVGTGKVAKGDLIVLTTGHPAWVKGATNMIRVKKI